MFFFLAEISSFLLLYIVFSLENLLCLTLKRDLLTTKPLSENLLTSPHSWTYLGLAETLLVMGFFPQHLITMVPFPPGLHGLWEDICCQGGVLIGNTSFFFSDCSHNCLCHYHMANYDILVWSFCRWFIPFGVDSTSWICRFVLFHKFETIFSHFFEHVLNLSLSLPLSVSLSLSLYVCLSLLWWIRSQKFCGWCWTLTEPCEPKNSGKLATPATSFVSGNSL